MDAHLAPRIVIKPSVVTVPVAPGLFSRLFATGIFIYHKTALVNAGLGLARLC
jgi:hypothetical protein